MNIFRKLASECKHLAKCIIFHTPKNHLSQERLSQIQQNGLIHFTLKEKIDSIISSGIISDSKRAMRNSERNMIWTYLYVEDESYINNKLNEIRSKGDRKNTNAMIIIKDLSNEQLLNLRARPKLDDAIAYIGTLKTNNMSYRIFE